MNVHQIDPMEIDEECGKNQQWGWDFTHQPFFVDALFSC